MWFWFLPNQGCFWCSSGCHLMSPTHLIVRGPSNGCSPNCQLSSCVLMISYCTNQSQIIKIIVIFSLDINSISDWISSAGLQLNPNKTKFMVTYFKETATFTPTTAICQRFLDHSGSLLYLHGSNHLLQPLLGNLY